MTRAVAGAVEENKAIIEEEKITIPELQTDSRDICAGFDGTWQRRGHQSLNGVVTCTSIDSGKVMDIEVLSKYCLCLDKTNHEIACAANHQGSSGSMEGIESDDADGQQGRTTPAKMRIVTTVFSGPGTQLKLQASSHSNEKSSHSHEDPPSTSTALGTSDAAGPTNHLARRSRFDSSLLKNMSSTNYKDRSSDLRELVGEPMSSDDEGQDSDFDITREGNFSDSLSDSSSDDDYVPNADEIDEWNLEQHLENVPQAPYSDMTYMCEEEGIEERLFASSESDNDDECEDLQYLPRLLITRSLSFIHLTRKVFHLTPRLF
ncbi:uncharacterized protein LOC124371223 [Homalodisca vitripennis]|uniref:uncharacterized protein LOC124371223 n=1 Tax=Homalodisca vitripennis TaxID=197043 RepID=UPI001EEAAD57|nr:uncharacterized protein LOC124371223 [Homalodisca vitripennis]